MSKVKNAKIKLVDYYNQLKEWIVNFKFKRDYLVFMAFFLLSAIFWLLKSLNKNYESEINYPLRFSSAPKGMIVEQDLPNSVRILVEDAGFQLLQNILTPGLNTVNINLKNLSNRNDRKISDSHYYVLTSDYKDAINRGLASTSKLIDIYPDTIHVYMSRQVEAKVPVRLVANITPARQRLISGQIVFDPDSISIFGSKRLIDTIEAVYTVYQDFKNLEDTLVRNIALEQIDEIQYSQTRVNISIPVEMFTEKTITIPVEGINFPDSLNLRAFPGLANVEFFVGLSSFQMVNEKDFRILVDYNSLNGNVSGKIKPQVICKQRWIDNIRVIPEEIDYMLELVNK